MKDKLKIIAELKKVLLSKFGNRIKNVILFGSQALGKSSDDSDYDILVVVDRKPDWQFERAVSDICYEIELKYNIFIDTLILSESELGTIRGKQPVYENALKNGIYI